MRRELRVGGAALWRRPLASLALWSVPETLPAMVSGLAVARALDRGFLAGHPLVGLAWLAALLAAAVVGAVGARQVYRHLGDLVEPFRDELVHLVVGGALRHAVSGRPDDGAVARLTHQVEIVRDSYGGMILVLRNFLVMLIGAVVGLSSLAPVILLLVLPPFALGCAMYMVSLGMATNAQREYIRADERLATTAGAVLAGTRDVVACGGEAHAVGMATEPIREAAAAERALARVSAVRTLCFAVGGWLPLVLVLAAGPWLVRRGLTAGAIIGGLTYVLSGLQPALGAVVQGMGGSGLRFVVTLGRILDAGGPPVNQPKANRPVAVGRAAVGRATVGRAAVGRAAVGRATVGRAAVGRVAGGGTAHAVAGAGYQLATRSLTFAYGPHAAPVLRRLDLVVPERDHLAVVGPSGVGKSTLASLLCGLLRPDAGMVLLGGVPVARLAANRMVSARVLIPQEAYVFTGTVWDNLTYLRPTATPAQVAHAVYAVGADALVARVGGLRADLSPAELSAGERQLVGLVRAYLSPAPVAVLDEATCHLDPRAERRAEEAFAGRGGTLIVIAHRMSSALRARRVLVLDGVGAAVGDHDTLLATSPLYQELLGHWEVRPVLATADQIHPDA
ncbi:MAG: transporter ATP-binding protein [Dactylosporangium sp.]|nr:transporter ATP-binding protein [Dactylosporangium sp.]